MLKITKISQGDALCVLKLEGKLLQPWIDEVGKACRQARETSPHIVLDLSGVSFLDPPGTSLLRELIRQGFALKSCSPLVAELLKESHT